MIKKDVVRFPFMVGSTADMAVDTCSKGEEFPVVLIEECVEEKAAADIYFHLHLIHELIERVHKDLEHGKPFSAADLDSIDEHLRILEGSHQEQNKHMPKPPENVWTPEQRTRQRAAAQFTNILRRRCRSCYQEESDRASLPSSPHTPPPHAKSA